MPDPVVSPTALPTFPSPYTEEDAARLAELEAQKKQMELLQQSKFSTQAWADLNPVERETRELLAGTSGVQENLAPITPMEWGLGIATPDQMKAASASLDKEFDALVKRKRINEVLPSIQKAIRALALTSGAITKREDLNSKFHLSDMGFSEEDISYLDNYARSIYRSSPEDIASGELFGLDPLSPEQIDQYSKTEAEPRHILSSIAFSQDSKDFTLALQNLYKPNVAVTTPVEEIYSKFKEETAGITPEATEEAFKALAEEGKPIGVRDDTGNREEARLKSNNTVWDTKGNIIGYKFPDTDKIYAFNLQGQPMLTQDAEESLLKDYLDVFCLAVSNTTLAGDLFFADTFPNMLLALGERKISEPIEPIGLFEDPLTSIKRLTTEEQREVLLSQIGQLKSYLRGVGRDTKTQYDLYLLDHPEMQPKMEWANKSVNFSNLHELGDPAYLGYVIISNAVPTVMAWLIGTGTMIATAPVLGASGTLVGATVGAMSLAPLEVMQLHDEWLANGGSEDDADVIGTLVGTLSASTEILPNYMMLAIGQPLVMKAFRLNLAKAAIQTIAKKLVLKGLIGTGQKIGWDVLWLVASNVIQEDFQEMITNATIMTLDKKRGIFDNVQETTVNATVFMIPSAFLGGAISYAGIRANMSADAKSGADGIFGKYKDQGLTDERAEEATVAALLSNETTRDAVMDAINTEDAKVPVKPADASKKIQSFNTRIEALNKEIDTFNEDADYLETRIQALKEHHGLEADIKAAEAELIRANQALEDYTIELENLQAKRNILIETGKKIEAQEQAIPVTPPVQPATEVISKEQFIREGLVKYREEIKGTGFSIDIELQTRLLGEEYDRKYGVVQATQAQPVVQPAPIQPQTLTPAVWDSLSREQKLPFVQKAVEEHFGTGTRDYRSVQLREALLEGTGQDLSSHRAADWASLEEAYAQIQPVAQTVPAQAVPAQIPSQLKKIAIKWSEAKARNSTRANADLDSLEASGIDAADARAALTAYMELDRSEYDDAESYAEDRTAAWDEFVSALDAIEEADTPVQADTTPSPYSPPSPMEQAPTQSLMEQAVQPTLNEHTIFADSFIESARQRAAEAELPFDAEETRIIAEQEYEASIRPPVESREYAKIDKLLPQRFDDMRREIVDNTQPDIAAHIRKSSKATNYQELAKTNWLNADITTKEGLNIRKSMLTEVKLPKSLAVKSWNELSIREVELLGVTSIAKESEKLAGYRQGFDVEYIWGMLEDAVGIPLIQGFRRIKHYKAKIDRHATAELHKLGSVPASRKINQDAVISNRIRDYIHSKNPANKMEAPANMTPEELFLADEIERGFLSRAPMIRFNRVMNTKNTIKAFEKEFPDAVKAGRRAELENALTIKKMGLEDSLWDYLYNKTWGVIGQGYFPIWYDKVSLIPPSTDIGTTRGEARFLKRGVTYHGGDAGKTLFQEVKMYIEQVESQFYLRPELEELNRVWSIIGDKFAKNKELESNIEAWTARLQGIPDPMTAYDRAIMDYHVNGLKVIFFDWALSLRNLAQSWILHPDRIELLKVLQFEIPARTNELGKLYYDAFVGEEIGISQDLLHNDKNWQSKNPAYYLAEKLTFYGWTDHVTRTHAYFASLNKAQRATTQYLKDGNVGKWIKDSGAVHLNQNERNFLLSHYLGLINDKIDLGIDGLNDLTGADMANFYVAQRICDMTNFAYTRSMRSFVEMGKLGKSFWSLFVFPRGYAQRFYFQAEKVAKALDGKATWEEAASGFKDIIGIAVAAQVYGTVYKRVTRTKKNPYDPLNIMLSWAPGGLYVGLAADLAEVIYYSLASIGSQGEEAREIALSKLPSLLTNVAETQIPLYRRTIDALDVIFKVEGWDNYQLRLLRAKIDKDYTPDELEVLDRDLWGNLTKGFLGVKTIEPEKFDLMQTELRDAQDILGIRQNGTRLTIDAFGTKIKNGVAPYPDYLITLDNGFSELVMFYMECQETFKEYDALPSTPAIIRTKWRLAHPEEEARMLIWGKLGSSNTVDPATGNVIQGGSVFAPNSPGWAEVRQLMSIWSSRYGITASMMPKWDSYILP